MSSFVRKLRQLSAFVGRWCLKIVLAAVRLDRIIVTYFIILLSPFVSAGGRLLWRQGGPTRLCHPYHSRDHMGSGWHVRQCRLYSQKTDASRSNARYVFYLSHKNSKFCFMTKVSPAFYFYICSFCHPSHHLS